jgi:hypothetical protein
MSEEDKIRYAVEEIPIEKANDRSSELGLSKDIIDNLKKSGETKIYFVHKVPVIFKIINKT